jgi:hypothetical protein
VFQQENRDFNVKEASYRKVSAYTKCVERYKRERERRRQVRLLAEKGFTQRQIASELDVSTRTIKRDWDKIRSYVKGQFNKEIREIVDERSERFERRYEGLTFNEELKLLKQDVKEVSKKARALQTSSRPQEQHRSQQLDVTLNFDDPTKCSVFRRISRKVTCLEEWRKARIIQPPLLHEGQITFQLD